MSLDDPSRSARGGRPPKAESDRLSVVLNGARFDDLEFRELDRRARRAGLSRSAWARDVLLRAELTVRTPSDAQSAALGAVSERLNKLAYALNRDQPTFGASAVESCLDVLRAHREQTASLLAELER